MQVELCDHVGYSPNGDIVVHDQWIVRVDDVQIGYLPKAEGAYLQCIVFMDDATKAEVIAAIEQAAKQSIGGAAMPVDPDIEPQDEDDDE
jgi:hypothetical protein